MIDISQEVKTELSYDLAIPLLISYLKNTKHELKKIQAHILLFTEALFIITKIWKLPKCSTTEEQIKKNM